MHYRLLTLFITLVTTQAFGETSTSDNGPQAVEGINKFVEQVKPKWLRRFELAPRTTADAGWGVDYELYQSRTLYETYKAGSKFLYAYEVKAEGGIGEKSENSVDFNRASLSGVGFFGWTTFELSTPDQTEPPRANETIIPQLGSSPPPAGSGKLVVLPSRLSIDLLIEGDRKFDSRNYAGGASITLNRGLIGTRSLGWLDDPFQTGSAPGANRFLLYLGLHQVDASKSDLRKGITSDTDFLRASAEFSYTVPVSRLVRIGYSVQWHHEFSAPNPIRLAGHDDIFFHSLIIHLPGDFLEKLKLNLGDELFLKYTAGDLPLDLQGNEQLSVGFSWSWGNVKE